MEMIFNRKTIGQKIKTFRNKMGFTQSELADIIGCSKQRIYYLEHGRREPLAVEVFNLAYVFGITMYDFGRVE